MPATAGRVRMPANNRVHSSAALQTHGIWQSAIGYDPYAPNKDESKSSSQPKASVNSASEPEGDNAYANFQGLLALARITGSNTDEARGSCKRCGRVGHLSFQCRNFLSVKDDIKEKDSDAIQAAVLSGLEKIKGGRRIGGKEESDEEEEEEESDEEDSEVDSEIERIIASKNGKRRSSGGRSLKKKDDDDESESDDEGRKKRGRSKKRRSKKRESSDSEEDEEVKRKKRRKEKRRKRDDSSDEEEEEENRRRRKRKSRKEKRRRRSHRYSDDSDSDTSEDSGRRHVRKSRKAASPSDSDASGSDDSRVGRGTKRSEMRSKKRHHDKE